MNANIKKGDIKSLSIANNTQNVKITSVKRVRGITIVSYQFNNGFGVTTAEAFDD